MDQAEEREGEERKAFLTTKESRRRWFRRVVRSVSERGGERRVRRMESMRVARER